MIEPLKGLRGMSTLKINQDLEFFQEWPLRNIKCRVYGIHLSLHTAQGDQNDSIKQMTTEGGTQ
jgi:hypothetical protein